MTVGHYQYPGLLIPLSHYTRVLTIRPGPLGQPADDSTSGTRPSGPVPEGGRAPNDGSGPHRIHRGPAERGRPDGARAGPRARSQPRGGRQGPRKPAGALTSRQPRYMLAVVTVEAPLPTAAQI